MPDPFAQAIWDELREEYGERVESDEMKDSNDDEEYQWMSGFVMQYWFSMYYGSRDI